MNHIEKFFTNAYLNKRLSHLYLLTGPKGSGKYREAVHVAHLLLSEGTLDEKTLELIHREEHPNFFHLQKDGQTIKKQQIMDLQTEFSKTSLQKGARVYVISDIEALSSSAANSLLKFMEEPENAQTYGFLLTTQSDQILPTIISRSQVIKMPMMQIQDLIDDLIRDGIEPLSAHLMALNTQDKNAAKIYIEDQNYQMLETLFVEIIEGLLSKSYVFPIEINRYRNLLNTDRNYMRILLEYILIYLLDLIHIKRDLSPYFSNLETDIKQTADHLESSKIMKTNSQIQKLIRNQNAYVNMDLMIDEFSIILNQLVKGVKS